MKTGIVGIKTEYYGLFYSKEDIDAFVTAISRAFDEMSRFYKSDPNIGVKIIIEHMSTNVITIPHVYTGYKDDIVSSLIRLSSYGSVIVKDPLELEKVLRDAFNTVKNLTVTVAIQTFEKDY